MIRKVIFSAAVSRLLDFPSNSSEVIPHLPPSAYASLMFLCRCREPWPEAQPADSAEPPAGRGGSCRRAFRGKTFLFSPRIKHKTFIAMVHWRVCMILGKHLYNLITKGIRCLYCAYSQHPTSESNLTHFHHTEIPVHTVHVSCQSCSHFYSIVDFWNTTSYFLFSASCY